MRLQVRGALQMIGFLLQLFAKLAGHLGRARPTQRPIVCASFGSFCGSLKHDQRDAEDHQNLGKIDSEH